MSNLTVKIDKEEFLKKSEQERSYITYSVVQDLQERLNVVEQPKPWWDQSKSFIGGVLGGALVMIGKVALWR